MKCVVNEHSFYFYFLFLNLNLFLEHLEKIVILKFVSAGTSLVLQSVLDVT